MVPVEVAKRVEGVVVELVPELGQTLRLVRGSGKRPELEVRVLSGGYSGNAMYRVRAVGCEEAARLPQVVVREMMESWVQQDREAELFWQARFFKTWGRSENLVCYEYLDGYETIGWERMREYADEIAGACAAFHLDARRAVEETARYADARPRLVEALGEWMPRALGLAESFFRNTRAYHDLDWAWVVDEVRWFTGLVHRVAHRLPVVPCHNDAHGANLMLKTRSDGSSDVRFVDFEYMRPNYAFYELANTLCEFATWTDYHHSKLASEAELRAFVTRYLDALAVPAIRTNQSRKKNSEGGNKKYNKLTTFLLDDQSTDEVVALVSFLTLGSHLHWALWCVLEAAYSNRTFFDYLRHANLRLASYRRDKLHCFTNLLPFFTAIPPEFHPDHLF